MAKPIAELNKDLQKFLNSIVTKDLRVMFAQKAADTIYKRTKSGKGLSSYKGQNNPPMGGVSLKAIKPLSTEYVEYRKTRILGPFGSPKRSNLTLSGELLESIIIRVSGQDVFVEIDKASHGSGISISTLAHFVSEQGRPFFGLADNELKTLNNFVQRTIRDRIRKLQKSI